MTAGAHEAHTGAQQGNVVLEVALVLAGGGLAVLPLYPRSEKPLPPGGVRDATTDRVVIRRWFDGRPGLGLGVATGAVSRIAVLVVDPQRGGDAALAALEAQHGRLPPTRRVRTGGGGRHHYFRLPADRDVPSATLAPGVEVRGTGGFVAAPPSLDTGGRPLAWEGSADGGLAELPGWISDRLRAAPTSTTSGGRRRASQATTLVRLVDQAHADLFHAGDGEAYATLPVDAHRETWALRSTGAVDWLKKRFYDTTRAAPTAQAIRDALGILEARARFEGAERRVYTRVAEHAGRLYLDLANTRWEVVEISAEGYRVIENPPVVFRRTKGMLALPAPVTNQSLDGLRRFVNVAADDDWRLLAAWEAALLRPGYPFPALVLQGEQGSAKTTTAKALRTLVDPHAVPLRRPPRDARDLSIAAKNAWIVAFDNMSHLPPDLSDDLCRLATGAGYGTRKLYTDDEEQLFNTMRPVLVNGIEELATRPDFLDRAIILDLPRIEEKHRKREEVFWREFNAAWPALLGALLDVASRALSHVAEAPDCATLPRMADFARWGSAVERVLEWPPSSFRTAYERNRDEASVAALEASLVAQALLKYLAENSNEGAAAETATAAEWLARLSAREYDPEQERFAPAYADETVLRSAAWPRTPKAFGNALRRLAPSLRAAGIAVTFLPRQGARRPVQIQRLG